MPLLPGKANVGRNIKTEEAAGKPHRQAVAIALNTADKKKGRGKLAKNKTAKDMFEEKNESKKERVAEAKHPMMEKKENVHKTAMAKKGSMSVSDKFNKYM